MRKEARPGLDPHHKMHVIFVQLALFGRFKGLKYIAGIVFIWEDKRGGFSYEWRKGAT
jgi:hypothetical protein